MSLFNNDNPNFYKIFQEEEFDDNFLILNTQTEAEDYVIDEDYASIYSGNIELNIINDNSFRYILTPAKNKTNKAEEKEKSDNNPIFNIKIFPFLENDINNIIKTININEEKKKLLFLSNDENNEVIKNFRNNLFFKEKKRIQNQFRNTNIILNSKKGRKLKNDNSNRTHNKYSPDNIIKSIKTKINDSLILFVNKLIYSIYDIKEINIILEDLDLPRIKKDSNNFKVLKKNDYKTRVKKTSKLHNLELLSLTINEYISYDVSSKYKNYPSNYNRLIIEKLLEDKQNRDIFNFIFNNLKIEDWLDIFLYKKEIDYYINSTQLNEYKINIIKESLVRIDNDFFEMFKKDKIYLYCFTLMIYNIKRYLLMKEGRTLKMNNEN